MLLVTHNSAISKMADRVIHLHSGSIVEDHLQPADRRFGAAVVSTLSRALWREIRRRPAQFLSVAVVIALGVGMFNASFDAYLNLTDSYKQLYRETSFAHVTAIGGPSAAVLAAGSDMPGLQASATRTVADVPFQPRPGHTLIGRVVGMPAIGSCARR